MTPELETYLWERITLSDHEIFTRDRAEWDRVRHEGRTARDIIHEMLERKMIASPKQAWRTLEKWCDGGWYDYGVCLDLGWRTRPERADSFAEPMRSP